MNAISEIVPAGPVVGWTEVHALANAWRGQAIHHITHAERAVTEALLVLAAVPERGNKVRLEGLLGQRLGGLRGAVGEGGPFAAEGVAASKALAAFQPFEPMRTALCHGAGRVAVDVSGRWVLVLNVVEIRKRTPVRSRTVYEQVEAEALLETLKLCVGRLSAVLGNLRKTVA